MSKISLNQQIEEVEHELSMRDRVYPNLISKGKLSRSKADYHVERMRAVRATLQWLADNEAAIKQRVAK